MNKRILFVSLGLLGLGLALGILLMGWSSEPSFEGRPFTYWKQQLKAPDYMARYRACTAMWMIGPPWSVEAVPELIDCVHDSEFLVRTEACHALGKAGSGAKEAIPDLIVCLKDWHPHVRDAAARALKRIDYEAAHKAGVE